MDDNPYKSPKGTGPAEPVEWAGWATIAAILLWLAAWIGWAARI